MCQGRDADNTNWGQRSNQKKKKKKRKKKIELVTKFETTENS